MFTKLRTVVQFSAKPSVLHVLLFQNYFVKQTKNYQLKNENGYLSVFVYL